MSRDLVYAEHRDAGGFLAVARTSLEREESLNALMLGVALRLVCEPQAYGGEPYFATVESSRGLRAAALMTPPYRLQIFAEDDRDLAALELIADGLTRGEWPVPGVIARQVLAEGFASIWCRRAGVGHETVMRERAYELRQVVHPRYPAGEFRPAGPKDRWTRPSMGAGLP